MSYLPHLGIIEKPDYRKFGISAYMRVKNEADWIEYSLLSIKDFADELIIGDNGSTDGTVEIISQLISKVPRIRLFDCSNMGICELSNFLIRHATYSWIVRWDGDMVARTSGPFAIQNLRKKVSEIDRNKYYTIFISHICLAGDLFHQDPRELTHTEEYIHTNSSKLRFVHPERYEAIKSPKYYKILKWDGYYSFHINVKPARRMLLRHFWEDWMELKDYRRYPRLEDYVKEKMEEEFETKSWEEAQEICVQKVCNDYIPYDQDVFGPYPDLLRPHFEKPKYMLKYEDGKIVGRDEA